ncbi:DUF6412 domain-containing protein [Microbacterium sp.]|uniref:DUF6412 domain-containing protein n=1 Tax=Microbacterium sp. TaxID=51671 RepID=UPI0039E4BEA4
MGDLLRGMLGFAATALGVILMPDAAALGLAIAFLAVTTLTIALALSFGAITATADAPHPLRAIDAGAPLAQSDPDAAGHPRPRAPGAAVPA